MKLRVSSCLLLVALLVPFPIAAQQSSSPEIDVEIDRFAVEEMVSLHEPSLAISIVKDGQLIFAKGYGTSDVENNVPATADTVYRIASISKSLTATAAMRLVEEHRLELDVPVQKYCPSFPMKQWPTGQLRQAGGQNSTSGWPTNRPARRRRRARALQDHAVRDPGKQRNGYNRWRHV